MLSTLAAGAAHAQTGLARDNGCLVCHSVQRKVVGPAFEDVARRYAGDDGAVERLTQRVLRGSVGQWGTQAMPANVGTSPDEARILAAWVLTLGR
ncbi:cytochrome C' [Xylophilus rhododendri]|uniref:Cytochrome C n=1 Tax=Xylophilus rhododendri TaxID=2697032 RepID=A0A857JEN1_9BURK|nr:cytochrome C' [Xylophilus rhododendri]